MTTTLFVLSFLAGPFGREVMPDLPNDVAHDWFGLATWAIIAAVFVCAIFAYFKLKTLTVETKNVAVEARNVAAHTGNVAAATKEQITNGHPDLFRKDFDKLVGKVEAESEERRSDVADLRTEIRGIHAKLDELIRRK